MMSACEGEKPVVLVVDDEPQVAAALTDLLEDRFRVIACTSAAAALAALQEDKDVSVILSDQRMPEMSGDELLARAREISLATRILITAYADITAVIEAVNAGKIFGYVTKPWHARELMQLVSKAAEHCELNRRILHEQALLHQLMESSIDAIAIKDARHRYVRANTQAARLLGAESLAQIEGRLDEDFLGAERAARRQRHERQVMDSGTPLRDCLEAHADEDGCTTWQSSTLSPIRDAGGEVVGVLTITRDVTEAKRLEAMKDQFIATVSHELRTPLTAIRGSLDLLKARFGGPLDERGRRLVEIGFDNCSRLIGLVNDLLDTVRLEKGEMAFRHAPVSIADIVRAAAAAAGAAAARKGVAIAVASDLPELRVDGDRERLLQVLAKLVGNAIDVTPAGGRVRLAARPAGAGTVRVSVHDDGPGVPRTFLPRLFTRFAQADSSTTREKGGVGLGLHIAKAIIEAHGGRIGLADRAGPGAEFYFELPALAADTGKLRMRM